MKKSYEWSVGTSDAGFKTIRNARRATLKITNAIYKSAQPPEGRRVYCIATARNAGGSLGTGLTSLPLKK